jgi:ABC-2 type transport system permease protein
MSPLMRRLVMKELYLGRWVIGSGLVGGLVSLCVMPFGMMAFNVGALCWLSTVVAFGVILAMQSIVNERKDSSLLFSLSLPLTPRQYMRAKQIGLLIGFLITWIPLALASCWLVIATDLPDGLLSFAVLLNLFLLANYTVVLGGTLLVRSEGAVTGIIIVTNMGVTLFMFMIGGLSEINSHFRDATPAWSNTHTAVLAGELLVLVAALALPLLAGSRHRDWK